MSTMTYLDFDLEIDTGDGFDYTVKALQAQMGEARAAVRWLWSELQLENRLKDLQIALLRSGGVRRDFRYPEEEAVQRFGQELFELIFTGDVRSRYDVTQERARQQGKGVRLKLRIQAPRLAILPWEFLYDGRAAEYICLSRNTPVVRYLELPQSIQPLTVTLPLRILGMIASPSDLPALDVAVEKERVERAVQELKKAGSVELTWLNGQTWRDLHREMRRGPWHIFHFVGHGDFDSRRQEGEIVLTGADGKAQPFSATDFARLLADHRTLRLALLNACKGAHGGVKDIFAGTAARLVRSGLPAVIAMQHAITDMAAIEFSQGFYESLADGLAVDAAMSEARKAIVFGVANSLEWGTPVLYMRAPDGVLFQLEKETERARDQETERARDREIKRPRDRETERVGEQGGEGQRRGDASVEAGEPAAQPVTPQPQSTARITNHQSRSQEPAAPSAGEKRSISLAGMNIPFVYVLAGPFTMGSEQYDSEKPIHEVTVDAFWMMQTPVTVALFAKFVNAMRYRTTWQHPLGTQSDVKQKGDHPVTCVSWHDAVAFCHWATAEYNKSSAQDVIRLPTEAEWEKAARGTDGRIYPWGNEAPDANRCNFYFSKIGDTTPVTKYGKAGASPYDVWDMAGNVWEWTGSLHKSYPYKKDDRREEANGWGGRVLRGGSFVFCVGNDVRCAYRRTGDPYNRHRDYGFRVCLPRL